MYFNVALCVCGQTFYEFLDLYDGDKDVNWFSWNFIFWRFLHREQDFTTTESAKSVYLFSIMVVVGTRTILKLITIAWIGALIKIWRNMLLSNWIQKVKIFTRYSAYNMQFILKAPSIIGNMIWTLIESLYDMGYMIW